MGIIKRFNIQRHSKTLRSLDYENMPTGAMREGSSVESGRLSDELYEGTSRVPRSKDGDEDAGPEPTAHLPVAGERPHPKAQWDDVRGEWVIWSDEAADWVPVTDAE
jgi:hypothetical protein